LVGDGSTPQSINNSGLLNATGGINLSSNTNSSSAFQVQNASGTDSSTTLLDLSTIAPAGNLITNGNFSQDTNGWQLTVI